MRKYKGNCLTAVVCNGCGKKLVVNNGIVREGVTHITVDFVHPVNIAKKTELI